MDKFENWDKEYLSTYYNKIREFYAKKKKIKKIKKKCVRWGRARDNRVSAQGQANKHKCEKWEPVKDKIT